MLVVSFMLHFLLDSIYLKMQTLFCKTNRTVFASRSIYIYIYCSK